MNRCICKCMVVSPRKIGVTSANYPTCLQTCFFLLPSHLQQIYKTQSSFTKMPLSFPIFTDSPEALQKSLSGSTKPQYVIFFASLKPETNESWCGDCRSAEGPLSEKLHIAAKEDRVKLIYGGSQAEYVAVTRKLGPK